jgi:threonine dehydratase
MLLRHRVALCRRFFSLPGGARTAAGPFSSSAAAVADAEHAEHAEHVEHAAAAAAAPAGAVIGLSDITRAHFRIKPHILDTPFEESRRLSELFDATIYTKLEFKQATGSFKERGAANVILQLDDAQMQRGVVAASAGNHALALARHGPRSGVPVTVVMPVVAPLTKVSNCRSMGARVIVEGNHLLESRAIADKLIQQEGLTYVNGYDDPAILAGQGTIGLEMLQAVPDLDAVVVPIGGGGLIAGVATAVKQINPNCLVIGVEPSRCASWTAALEAGAPVSVEANATLADGLAVTTVGSNAFACAKDLIDKVVVVSESSIALSILRLLELESFVVEGGGATAIAGFIDGKLDELKGKKVGVILCGGNIDMPVLGRVIERGLTADGRMHRFVANVSDRPGGIAHLTDCIAKHGASVKDLHHERASVLEDVAIVAITATVETRDAAHAEELRRGLAKEGLEVRWGGK